MSIYGASITNPKKQLEFYKDLSEQLQQENKELKEEIRKYQKDKDINTNKHLEIQDYIKSRIKYCKEMTGFDCCIEELEEVLKII